MPCPPRPLSSIRRVVAVASVAGLAAADVAVAAASDAPASSISAWTLAWGAGLISGMVVMTMLKIDWRDLPQLMSIWLRRQRRNAWWAALGAVSLGVLIFA